MRTSSTGVSFWWRFVTEPTRNVDLADLSGAPASGAPGEGGFDELAMSARQRSARFSIVEEPQGASEVPASEEEASAPAPVTVPVSMPVATPPPPTG